MCFFLLWCPFPGVRTCAMDWVRGRSERISNFIWDHLLWVYSGMGHKQGYERSLPVPYSLSQRVTPHGQTSSFCLRSSPVSPMACLEESPHPEIRHLSLPGKIRSVLQDMLWGLVWRSASAGVLLVCSALFQV